MESEFEMSRKNSLSFDDVSAPTQLQEIPPLAPSMDDPTDASKAELQGARPPPNWYFSDQKSHIPSFTEKSLFFCMTLENPFHFKEKHKPEDQIIPHPSGFPTSYINDELLCTHPNDARCTSGQGEQSSLHAILGVNKDSPIHIPNRFQKTIEILLRLKARKLDVQPDGMLARVASPESVPRDEGGEANYFRGCMLVKKTLFTSPDEDEINIKIHASQAVMLSFAEERGIIFSSHIYSFGGGKPMVYSQHTEAQLANSVEKLFKDFPEVAKKYYASLGLGESREEEVRNHSGVNMADQLLSADIRPDQSLEKEKAKKRRGFIIRNTDKQRIMTRLIRDPWQFGGCGIQVDEMVKKGVLVKHFFPLHNTIALEARGLVVWGKLTTALQWNPLDQNVESIMDYFGEEVALYSYWMALYTKYLAILAVAGLACGIAGQADSHKALVSGVFACVCVVWGAGWNVFWNQREAWFGAFYSLDALDDQETIRDTYKSLKEVDITDDKLHTLQFNYPPSMVITSTGSLVEMHYPPIRRLLFRYLVSYPIILLLTGFMVALQCLITWWRLRDPNDNVVNYGSSFITLALSAFFDICFTKVIDMLNGEENNRTDNEEEYQTIMKRFFYYFFSKYFALYSLLLWPSDSLSDTDRLNTMEIQMLVTTVILPFIQNITETIMPLMKTRFRINYDMAKSVLPALIGTVMGKDQRHYPLCTQMADDAEELWLESQKEPLRSMGDDYLEILLQYGFMSMFAVTFPFAAVAAFTYNLFEIRVDANKLIKYYQRPYARPVTSIGAWKVIFGFIAVLAIVTNSFIISVMTTAVEEVGVGTLTPERRYQFFVGFQYVLGALAVLVFILVPSKPDNYLKIRVKQAMLANRLALKNAEEHRQKIEDERKKIEMADTLV